MKSIAICTSNVTKRIECARILGIAVESHAIHVDEIQTLDCAEVCRRKAADAYAKLQKPVIVDDTGLGLVALGGFPGALVLWALEASDLGLLYRMLPPGASDVAIATTVIGYADSQGVDVFSASLHGRILAEPRGIGGFGFDPIFVPDGQIRTFAEMTDSEKDEFSPRATALRSLREALEAR